MNRFYKLHKFLFEDEKYKNIGLNSKVAYSIYRDLVQQNKNVKRDKDGKVYIENPRKYLMETLNISINTVTKIHKELNKVGLIKDVWDDVRKPNIVYIKYCETPKPQVIHKTYETEKVEEKKEEIKPVEVKGEPKIEPEIKEELVEKITEKDLEDAKKVFERYKIGMIDLQVNKVFNNIRFYLFRDKEEKILKMAIRVLAKKLKAQNKNELLKRIGTSEVSLALE
ncbi:MAG: replication initiator protein A, partial [Clostridia bacterium]